MKRMLRSFRFWRDIGASTMAMVVATAVILAAVFTLHLRNEDALRDAMEAISDLRLARIDMQEGLAEARASTLTQSLSQREEGMRLLQEARSALTGLAKERPEQLAFIDMQFDDLIRRLEASMRPDAGNSESIELMATFRKLQNYAAQLDVETIRSLYELHQSQDTALNIVIAGSMILLVGMGANAYRFGRQRKDALAELRESEDRSGGSSSSRRCRPPMSIEAVMSSRSTGSSHRSLAMNLARCRPSQTSAGSFTPILFTVRPRSPGTAGFTQKPPNPAAPSRRRSAPRARTGRFAN